MATNSLVRLISFNPSVIAVANACNRRKPDADREETRLLGRTGISHWLRTDWRILHIRRASCVRWRLCYWQCHWQLLQMRMLRQLKGCIQWVAGAPDRCAIDVRIAMAMPQYMIPPMVYAECVFFL